MLDVLDDRDLNTKELLRAFIRPFELFGIQNNKKAMPKKILLHIHSDYYLNDLFKDFKDIR